MLRGLKELLLVSVQYSAGRNIIVKLWQEKVPESSDEIR